MYYQLQDQLEGYICLTDQYIDSLRQQGDVYLFVYVSDGELHATVDGHDICLLAGQLVSISPLQHFSIEASSQAQYACLLFNSAFYCIYGNDHEVSCSGVLFNGSSHIFHLDLLEGEQETVELLLRQLIQEFEIVDRYRSESLRILLKRYIILATRITQRSMHPTRLKAEDFELVRQFINLVDQHYLTLRRVQDYADLLGKSVRTLHAHLSACGMPSPLRVIHERLIAQANRLLLQPLRSATEVGYELGFDDPASFSRFFKKMNGESIRAFRARLGTDYTRAQSEEEF